jgi:hypothetical protein
VQHRRHYLAPRLRRGAAMRCLGSAWGIRDMQLAGLKKVKVETALCTLCEVAVLSKGWIAEMQLFGNISCWYACLSDDAGFGFVFTRAIASCRGYREDEREMWAFLTNLTLHWVLKEQGPIESVNNRIINTWLTGGTPDAVACFTQFVNCRVHHPLKTNFKKGDTKKGDTLRHDIMSWDMPISETAFSETQS